MPGERWAEVKVLLSDLANSAALDEARKHWYEISETWEKVDKIIGDPTITLDSSRAEGSAANYLLAGAKQMDQALQLGTMGPLPDQALQSLEWDIRALLNQMDDDEKGGPLGFGALPGVSSYEPTTAAGSIIRDALLREYDERAEVYLTRLNDTITQTVEYLDQAYTGKWPGDLPKTDPDGPRPTA